ncbi:SGNH/GDSL hydrolase family protein [Candidatus Fermentibacteria bacterium]|nr:SGNH/GDSL hydrolase family protein [Candidatus Fermentibacteria bacterium]
MEAVRVSINSRGLRGPEPLPRSAGGPARILFLGDSVTFGYAVSEESTFVGRVWEEGRRASPGWEAMNGGIEDAGIVEERMLLEEIGPELDPSLVVVCFYANDSRPPVGFLQEYLSEDPVDRWARTHPRIVSRSRLASFLHFRYRRLVTRFHLYRSPIPARFAWVDLWREGAWRQDAAVLDSLISLARFDWGAGWGGDGWALVKRELTAMERWCMRRGVALAVVYTPVQIEVEGRAVPEPGPGKLLEDLCCTMGLPFLDLLPRLRGTHGCYLDQCHYSIAGHRVVAGALLPWMRELIGGGSPHNRLDRGRHGCLFD